MIQPRLSTLLVLALAGCGSRAPAAHPPEPAPATPDAAVDAAPLHDDLAQLARRAVQLYEDISAAFAAAGTDCAAATTRLVELRGTHGEVTAANARVVQEGRGPALKAALAPYDARLDAAAAAIMRSPTLASCAEDPAFTTAFDELVAPRT
ncbi:MAG: hypothetical protein ACTHU0_01870 [Kofleriaceae bacterium]